MLHLHAVPSPSDEAVTSPVSPAAPSILFAAGGAALMPLAANDMGGGDLACEAIPALEKPAGEDGRTPRALICAIIWALLLFIADEAILEAAERLVPDH